MFQGNHKICQPHHDIHLLTSKCSFNSLYLNCKSNWFKNVYDYDITSQHIWDTSSVFSAAHSANYADMQSLSIRERNAYVSIFGARNLGLHCKWTLVENTLLFRSESLKKKSILFKKLILFIQQECTELIESDTKYICNATLNFCFK